RGVVEMGAFIAMWVGALRGGFPIAGGSPGRVGVTVLVLPVLGSLASRGIPDSPAAAPDLVINWNPVSETWRILAFMRRNRTVYLSVLGISWVWFLGAAYLSPF